jgi:multisubunit Na+/H+ antiporter MnhG subunit
MFAVSVGLMSVELIVLVIALEALVLVSLELELALVTSVVAAGVAGQALARAMAWAVDQRKPAIG